jgi:methionine-rich copper-binding protein CopC
MDSSTYPDTVSSMNTLIKAKRLRFTRQALMALLAVIVSMLAAVPLASPASAHGSTSSNLDAQSLEVAPENAEFRYSSDIDRTTAKASLRYLGDDGLDAEDYFALDVPTIVLEQVEPLTGIGPEFAFRLPKLGKGAYAIDWEVTPVADHADTSVTCFEVTVGVSDIDPVPVIAEGIVDDSLGVPASVESAAPPVGLMLALLGALVLIALLTAFYVFRQRKN